MGDRAVFGFKSEGHILFLYSHWGGSDQLATLQEAIRKAQPRWEDRLQFGPDEAYATRIAVSHIIGTEWDKETGYGLSIDKFAMPDYDYAYVVDWEAQTVTQIDTWDDSTDRPNFTTLSGPVHTFDKFLSFAHQEA